MNTSFLAFSPFFIIGFLLPTCVVLICVFFIYPRLRDSLRRKPSIRILQSTSSYTEEHVDEVRGCDGSYVSKLFFFWSLLIVQIVLFAITSATVIDNGGNYITEPTLLFNIVSRIGFYYYFVVTLVLCYKMWMVLPESAARTTPGKAVGFQLIPLFNFYWYFVAWWGWAKDFNRFAEQRQLAVPRISEGIVLAYCIAASGNFIVIWLAWFVDAPPLGMFFNVIPNTLLLIFIFQTCTTLNTLQIHIVQPKVETSGT